MLENKVKDIIDRLREVSKTKTIVLLDYDTNADVDNGRKPLSHASLIKAYMEGTYPYDPRQKGSGKATHSAHVQSGRVGAVGPMTTTPWQCWTADKLKREKRLIAMPSVMPWFGERSISR